MNMKSKTVLTMLGITVLLAFLTTPSHAKPPAHANDPIRLTFEKFLTDPINMIWTGTVDGDFSGTVTVPLTAGPRITGSIWHVSFHWDVDAGADSFEANVRGTINTKTGRVVLNGVVPDGSLEGARVHIEAQLFPDMHSEGTIRIMPSS